MEKKTFLQFMFATLLFLTGIWASAQNQKIIYGPTAGFDGSFSTGVQQTPDGGYLVMGADFRDFPTLPRYQARLIKLDANLQTQWDSVYFDDLYPTTHLFLSPLGDAVAFPDGDFAVGLRNDSAFVSTPQVMRVNADGSLQYSIALPGSTYATQAMGVLPNGNLLITSFDWVLFPELIIRHLDDNGNIVFSKSISLPANQSFTTAIIRLENGNLLCSKYDNNTQKSTFVSFDPDGNQLWETQPYSNYQTGLFPMPGGGFGHHVGLFNQFGHARIYDANGVSLGDTPDFPIQGQVFSVQAYPDGSFLVSGRTLAYRGYMLRMAPDGTTIWSVESPEDGQNHLVGLNGRITSDGWAIGHGNTDDDHLFGILRANANTGIFVNTVTGKLAKDDNDNCAVDAGEPNILHAQVSATNGNQGFSTFSNQNGDYTLYLPSGTFNLSVNPNEPFFDLCPTANNSVTFAPNASNTQTLDLPMQSANLIHTIQGNGRLDLNADCVGDANNPALQNWKIELKLANGQVLYDMTDNLGNYQMFVPSGNYLLSFYPWNNNYNICGASQRQVNISGTTPQVVTEDYLAYPEVNCYDMDVNLSGWGIRPCSTAILNVWYQNEGTIVAPDAQVEVVLDPALEFQSSSPAPTTINGSTLTYDLGDVPPTPGFTPNYIQINVVGDCDLQIGQQVCITAAITPNDPCGSLWNGAVIEVDDECLGDTAVFRIRNIGNGAQNAPLEFIIAEDQIVLRSSTFNIPPGGEQIEKVKINSSMSTVVITAEQEPGAPGDSLVSFSLTNCIGMSGGSPGGNGGNSSPYMVQKCLPVVNSYDPNDKNAQPLGFGNEKLVRPGTPLDYTIRFQNTGNDTAFLVVLRDTLSQLLNPSTVRVTASSHPFTMALVNGNILHFRYDNIQLPDSLT
ncbi:MAG: hypothetical protein IT269_06255, partial [Saprospiraceae bacterium]|nr:hypothetical protein [Saprospiraceae bacterium]